ncbi:MAG: aminotransferase class IV [Deltaproteobacteria bacterium]|nr:aminotransferase class IV [Deltaproteobacteria bacterium]
MKIFVNGKIVDPSEAKISVFDRSYLFGEGLFETLRSYNGALPFLDRHLARLEWSATFLGLPFPHPQKIKKGTEELLRENKLANARIKIILSGINEGIKPQLLTPNTAVNLLILMEKFVPLPETDYETGVGLSVIHSVRNEPPPVSNIKTTSYACKMIARSEFMERDSFDGILLDANGAVAETTSANLFWARNETVFTPPTSIGLLGGITRQIVMEILKEQNVPLKEQLVQPAELHGASEVFLTGSTLEVLPVIKIDDCIIGNGKPGLITQKIRSGYKHRVKREIAG